MGQQTIFHFKPKISRKLAGEIVEDKKIKIQNDI